MTAYGPAVQQNPVTGNAVTSLQPCNTWEWQAARARGMSLNQRPIYWSQYNTRYQQSCQSGIGCSSATPTQTNATAAPYYPRTRSGVVPVPTERRTNPADNRPQLDPANRQPTGGELRTQGADLDVTPHSWPVSHNNQLEAVKQQQVLDDSGWESEREW